MSADVLADPRQPGVLFSEVFDEQNKDEQNKVVNDFSKVVLTAKEKGAQGIT